MEAIVIAIIFYIGWKLVKFMIRRAKESDWEEKTKSAALRGITIKPVNTDQKFISSSYYPRDCERDSINAVTYNVIDFETANMYPDSVCQMAITEVVNNEVVKTHSYLIRPPYNDFRNKKIHGVSLDMVEAAPTFLELWPEIEPLINNKVIAAYNARFDIGCLEDTLNYFNIPSPDYAFFDILETARRNWRDLPNHKLITLSKHLRIKHNAHDAHSDTVAAAKVQIAAGEFYNSVNIKNMDAATAADILLKAMGAEQCWLTGKKMSDRIIRHTVLADYELPIRYFTAAIDKGINDAKFFRYYGELLERCGEVKRAIPYYQAALSLNDKIGVKQKLKKLLSDQQNEVEL